jgi:hypothetical protein
MGKSTTVDLMLDAGIPGNNQLDRTLPAMQATYIPELSQWKPKKGYFL